MTIPNVSKDTQITTNIGVIISILVFGFWISSYNSGYDKRISLLEQKQIQMESDVREIKSDIKKVLDILITQNR